MIKPQSTDELKGRKKRLNKNKKRNWRKNIDISAVEDALDVERLELRTGGIISEKKNKDLFFIDKTAVKDYVPKSSRIRSKRLRIDQIVTPDPSSVKPSKGRKRVTRRVERTLEKKLEKKERHLRSQSGASKQNSQLEQYDLWANKDQELYDKETKKNEITKYTEFIIGERQVKRPKHLLDVPNDIERYKFRNLQAVEVAHPGASYNPTYDDHQNLLLKAHQVEVDKLKSQEKVDRALHVPYDQLPDLGDREKEMQEGLFDENEEVDEVDEEQSGITANAPVRAADRKTRRKRRMEEKEKREREEREKTWGDKLRENEVFRTKTYLTEIRAKERIRASRRELRRKKLRMLCLSNVKFSEQDIELKLSEELRGSLRELKAEAGLLTDRYKSFQKRGIIEPRCKRRVPKRKRKIKFQEKRLWREIE